MRACLWILYVASSLAVILPATDGAHDGQSCLGASATIVGTGAEDIIQGTSGRDVINAGAGADIVRGRGGNDLICGGSGNDYLFGSGGSDRIDGGPVRTRSREEAAPTV